MKRLLLTLCAGLYCLMILAHATTLKQLNIRDPYILADKKSHTYFLYKSNNAQTSDGKSVGGVIVYKSQDLHTWEGPKRVFQVPEGNWITGSVWAPEVHSYRGKYYLFATLNCDIPWKASRPNWPAYNFRGTQIFWANSPEGPFQPFSYLPHTPIEEMALDGTLWIEGKQPYLIYCHEWVQIEDGAFCVRPLAKDLSRPTGPATTLFHASAAPWSTGNFNKEYNTSTYVSDGCFLYRTRLGKLLMLWSSFKNGQYAVGIAHSTTGSVFGPWVQEKQPIYSDNGGHAMLFRAFDGQLKIVLHTPNSPGGKERAKIMDIEDTGETLRIK